LVTGEIDPLTAYFTIGSRQSTHFLQQHISMSSPKKKSLVDYSRVESRPRHPSVGPAPQPITSQPQPSAAAAPAMSSNMQAVMRLMTGQDERTVRDKIDDPNRPTWDQYKSQNSDKLNLEGVDQKKMEEYRQQLDAQRDEMLRRGRNHRSDDKSSNSRKQHKDKKSKSKNHRRRRIEKVDASDDDSKSEESSSGSDRRRHKKHTKKSSKRRKETDTDDSNSESDRHRRKKHKKSKKKRTDDKEGDDSDGEHYRLSSFFSNKED
jgi:hypothetical protein